MVLLWVPLLDPFWRIFLLGFMKDNCLKRSLSSLLTYAPPTTLLLVLIHVSEALKFFNKLNDLHLSLSSIMEEENSHKLPFLDALVERSETVFQTHTHTQPHTHTHTHTASHTHTHTHIYIYKNVASYIEQVLVATPHKAPTIRPPASHHENYPSKTDQTRRTLLEKQS